MGTSTSAISKLIDPDLPRFLDLFTAIMVQESEDTLLPDFVEVFFVHLHKRILRVRNAASVQAVRRCTRV